MNKDIVDLVKERLEIGKREYDDQLNPFDGRNWKKEALEESLDLAIYICAELIKIKGNDMPPRKKKNIPNNFRGKEDLFFKKVRDGLKKFLESPFKESKNGR
tara:strand:+ start:1840 stop:2145 length:306 start_codon:yes stop_codon:yes gene_type:complete